MAWQDMIAGCFGNQDAKFALHPLDEERAKKAIAAAKAAGASRDDFAKAMASYVDKYVGDASVRAQRITEQEKILHKMWP